MQFGRLAWLPEGKRAAVCFHIDDIHPGTSDDPYEAGGDLGRGALGHVERLLERQPQLHVTLFTTPDWREISPWPTRRVLGRVPWLSERVYLTPVHPKGKMRLDRHPQFIDYLNRLPRTEIALHGLEHIHPGPRVPVEFAGLSRRHCSQKLKQALRIFDDAGLPRPSGMQPPAWEMSEELAQAMTDVRLGYACAARDILTPIAPGALTSMSGPTGLPLTEPALIQKSRLIHIPTNFQATSPLERAVDIIEQGGLLSIKGHIIKNAMGHIALDGIDGVYCNLLDLLFTTLEERYGEALWWPSLAQLCAHISEAKGDRRHPLPD